MPKANNLVAGLDIGTSKVTVVAGLVNEGLPQVVGVGLSPNSGLSKGVVVDIEDTVSAITSAVEMAERSCGTSLKYAFCGVSGTNIGIHDAKGVVAVSRADGEISESDVDRALEAAKVVAVPPNREILHVIPTNFSVDGQRGIKDPIGMTGVRLEVDAHVVSSASNALRNITKCIEQAGLDIAELVFSPLATSKTMLTKKQKESGAIMVDFGAGTTSLVVFEEGELVHAAILPIGSTHITNDIAIGLRISLDAAEKIKIKYGIAGKDKVKDSEMIPLSTFEPEEKERIERKYLAEIIEARLNEIFSMIREELKKIGKDGMLPAGIIITGAGGKLDNLADFAKEYLRLPASIGNPLLEVSGLVDQLDDPAYGTALGLMLWGLEDVSTGGAKKSLEIHKAGGQFFERARHLFRQFLP